MTTYEILMTCFTVSMLLWVLFGPILKNWIVAIAFSGLGLGFAISALIESVNQ